MGVWSARRTAVVGVDDAIAELRVGRVDFEGGADGEDGGDVHDEHVLVYGLVLEVADVLAHLLQPLVDDLLDLIGRGVLRSAAATRHIAEVRLRVEISDRMIQW
jgi:hypothetical protein